MQGDYRRLVNPPVIVDEVDIEGTREDRELMRKELKEEQDLIDFLTRGR